jgi:uncharacterized membrane protein
MTLQHTLPIHAGADVVWSLTEDVEAWPSTTPTMTSVERLDDGPLRVGSRARIKQPRLRPRVWTVTELEAPRRFAWQAKLGTVTMTGGHTIEPTAEGCRNTLTLELSGPGSRLLGVLGGRSLAAALRTENEGFRRAAEERTPSA